MKHQLSALLLGTALSLTAASAAFAQDKTIKIGVLTDNSGLYSDLGGAGSTVAAQMAVEDSGLAAKGWKIDIISADHQNKPDIGTSIARQWIDVEKVDIFMATYLGVPVSTTHTITGAIVGVGASRRVSAVRWNVASSIVYAWVITIPASALVAAATYWAVLFFR